MQCHESLDAARRRSFQTGFTHGAVIDTFVRDSDRAFALGSRR